MAKEALDSKENLGIQNFVGCRIHKVWMGDEV